MYARSWCRKHYGRWQRHGSSSPAGYRGESRSLDIEARLDRFSEARGDCLVWAGTTDKDGYGKTRNGGHAMGVHRIVFERAHGPIPNGLVVRHRCDNPPCIRLDHLELGTCKTTTPIGTTATEMRTG